MWDRSDQERPSGRRFAEQGGTQPNGRLNIVIGRERPPLAASRKSAGLRTTPRRNINLSDLRSPVSQLDVEFLYLYLFRYSFYFHLEKYNSFDY